MPTTYQVDMSKWAGTDVTGPISVTYDGATPTDPGPAGVVLRMLMAQASNDEAGLRACVTAKTMEMGKPAVPGKALSVHLSPPTEEGDRRIVNAKLSADGADQEIAFILIQEAGDWRVDMPLTIERLMGGSMEQFSELLEQGMKQMADGMAAAMQGLGEGLSQALGGSAGGEGEPPMDGQSRRDMVPAHPDLAAFRSGVLGCAGNGARWNVDAAWDTFDLPASELGREGGFLSAPLDEALTGISLIASSKDGAWDLGGVERFVVAGAAAGAASSVTRDGRTVTYTIDLASPMNADEFGQALAGVIEGLRFGAAD